MNEMWESEDGKVNDTHPHKHTQRKMCNKFFCENRKTIFAEIISDKGHIYRSIRFMENNVHFLCFGNVFLYKESGVGLQVFFFILISKFERFFYGRQKNSGPFDKLENTWFIVHYLGFKKRTFFT